MLLIQQITSDALQQQTLVLPTGDTFLLQLYFRPMQYGWFINQLTYGDFQLQGLRISNNPNLLYQWRNKLPFGLACYSSSGREPSQQEDFSSGASKLYVLTAAEVRAYTEILENG